MNILESSALVRARTQSQYSGAESINQVFNNINYIPGCITRCRDVSDIIAGKCKVNLIQKTTAPFQSIAISATTLKKKCKICISILFHYVLIFRVVLTRLSFPLLNHIHNNSLLTLDGIAVQFERKLERQKSTENGIKWPTGCDNRDEKQVCAK